MITKEIVLPSYSQIEVWQKAAHVGASSLLVDCRTRALADYAAMALPTNKDDDWRFMPLPSINWESYQIQPSKIVSHILPNGVFFGDVADFVARYPQQAAHYFGDFAGQQLNRRMIAVLVSAAWTQSVVLFVPRGVHAGSIDLRSHVADFVIEDLLIVVDAGASVTVYDAVGADKDSLHIRALRCFLHEDAVVNYVHDQQISTEATHLAVMTFYLHAQSVLNLFTAQLGGVFTKTWLDIILRGDCAHATINGLYVLDAKQQCSLQVTQQHCAPNTTSSLKIKGVLAGYAQAVYQGAILIEPSAYGTQAQQENKNLLLSSTARARSVPTIEVRNNDVHCGHGSAVGTFDEHQLFYLSARGIGQDMARRLLLQSFFSDLLAVCDDSALTSAIMKRIEKLMKDVA